jgi:hypothetical protein
MAHGHSASSARAHSARGPRPQRWLGPVHSARDPWLTGPASAYAARDGAARERTPERSPLSGHASRHGRWWCYSGGGRAKGGARVPTAERLPAGHGGGGDSSPELLVDGEGRKTGSAAAFSDEARAPVADGGPAMGRRRRVSGGSDAKTTTALGGTAHLARHRPTTTASAWRSDSIGGAPRTAGRRLQIGRACGWDGAREAR